MFLSAAMMLDWLGDRHSVPACQRAARAIEHAVERAFAGGTLVPVEHGGDAGTVEIAESVFREIAVQELSPPRTPSPQSSKGVGSAGSGQKPRHHVRDQNRHERDADDDRLGLSQPSFHGVSLPVVHGV